MNFSGKIKISDCDYDYHVENSEMVIIKSGVDFLRERTNIGWESILNIWLEVFSDDEYDMHSNCRQKYLMLLSYQSTYKGILRLNVVACISLTEYSDSVKSVDIVKQIAIRSKILDMFYWAGKNPAENTKVLSSVFCAEQENKTQPEKRSLKFNNKDIILSFNLIVALKYNYCNYAEKFPFDIFVSLNIECNKGLNPGETLTLCNFVKAFLSFVSNSREVFIEEILINSNCYMTLEQIEAKGIINYPFGQMFMAQATDKNNEITRVIPYDFIEKSISSIFDEIVNDRIFFISLFGYEKNVVSSVDIMNICATFENQFNKTFPKFKDDDFKKTKKVIMEKVNELVDFANINTEILSEFIDWISYYKGTLKSKLDYALNVFEKMFEENDEFWKQELEVHGGKDYKGVPERLKNARNKLSHGEKPKERQSLYDTYLLRAITYMLILKKANVDDKTVVECIKALFFK